MADFPCGECAKTHQTEEQRSFHRILEHPSMFPSIDGGSCFFCLARVANYFHVHDHVKEIHFVEHMILSRMADKLNKQVAIPKSYFFWLQVVFISHVNQRPAVMSGEEIMNLLWSKMEQLAAGVKEATQTQQRINQNQATSAQIPAVQPPVGTPVHINQPTASLPVANYPLQIDLGNGVFASLANRNAPKTIIPSLKATTSVHQQPACDETASQIAGEMGTMVHQAPSNGEQSSSAIQQPMITPHDFSLAQSMSLPQGLLPICTPITPSMMAALMGTPIVAAGSSQEDIQRMMEQQMIGGGCSMTMIPQEFAPSQMAALMGTPIIADNNNSHESLQAIVEQQMTSSTLSNGQVFADMPSLPQEISASMMVALMGTPILAAGSHNGSLEEIVEQQMSGGGIEPQEATAMDHSNSIATPPMLFATIEDEVMEEIVDQSDVSSVIPSMPQEVMPMNPLASGIVPPILPPGSCLETLKGVVDQQKSEGSDDNVVFKVPLLPHERPKASGEPPAKKRNRTPKIKGTANEPSVADVLKSMHSSGYKLQSRSHKERPPWRRWTLSQILRTLTAIPDPNMRHTVDPAMGKRDKSNSSQLAVIITSILCMRSEKYLKRVTEIEAELTAAIRRTQAFPDDDAALDAQLRATKYDINVRLHDDAIISPTLIIQPTIDQGWEIANVFLACLPMQWREALQKTFEQIRQTLILLMSCHPSLKEKLIRLKELLQLHIWSCIPTDPKYRAWILGLRKQLYGCDAPLPAWTMHAAALKAMPEITEIPDVFLSNLRSPPEDFPPPLTPVMAPPVSPDKEDGALEANNTITLEAPVPIEIDELSDQSPTEQVTAMVASIKRCTKAKYALAMLVPSPTVSAFLKAVPSTSTSVAAASAQSSSKTTSKTSPTPATSAPNTPPDSTTTSSNETSRLPVASTASNSSVPPEEQSVPAGLAQVISAIEEATKSLNQGVALRPFLPFAEAEQQYAEDRRIWLQKEKVSCRYGCAMMASSSGMVSHYRRYHYDVYFQAVHKACKEMSVKRWLNVRFGDEKEGKAEDKQEKRACLACHSGSRPFKTEYFDRMNLARHFKQSHPTYFDAIREDYFNVFKGLIEDDPVVHFLVEKCEE